MHFLTETFAPRDLPAMDDPVGPPTSMKAQVLPQSLCNPRVVIISGVQSGRTIKEFISI
jgi:hypothetical protein